MVKWPFVATLASPSVEPSHWQIVDERWPRIFRSSENERILLYEFTGACAVRVDREHRQLSVLSQECGPTEFKDLVLGQLQPRIEAEVCDLVLHGAAIETRIGTILTLGPSGAGKSTLAAALAHAGFPVGGDDSVALALHENRITARAVRPGIRLKQAIPRTTRALRLPRAAIGNASLAGVISLDPLPGDGAPQLIAATPAQATISMISQRFALDPGDPRLAAKHFTNASIIARSVPAFTLRLPRRFDALDDAVALIADRFGVPGVLDSGKNLRQRAA